MNSIAHFVGYLEHTIEGPDGLMENMCINGARWNYDEKYNLTIVYNGKALTLGMNADLYEGLVKLLKEECKEDISVNVAGVNMLEAYRIASTMFLQATDPNGCYTDENSMAEFGLKMDYATAIKYFAWYTNNEAIETTIGDVQDYPEYSLEYVKCNNLVKPMFDVLQKLSELNESSYEGREKYYRDIWDHNINGFVDGKFDKNLWGEYRG